MGHWAGDDLYKMLSGKFSGEGEREERGKRKGYLGFHNDGFGRLMRLVYIFDGWGVRCEKEC